MSKLTVIIGTVVGVIAVTVFVYVIWKILFPPAPKDILARAGYLEIVPPSTFHGPGTINTIEDISAGSVQLHPTCEIDDATLLEFRTVSETLDQEVRERLHGDFNATAVIENALASAAEAEIYLKSIESVTVRFENSKILMMSDEALFKVLNKLLQKDTCAEVVKISIDNGGRVCQSQSVFQADVTYEIALEQDVELAQQAEIMEGVSEALKLHLSRERGNILQAKSLYYGIKLSPLGVPLNIPGAKPVICRDIAR